MELWLRQFRWHEQFHGIPWNPMELRVRQFRWYEQFHGIPWNLECANFANTSSSMEFHGTWSAPISLTWEVPWNSMELWVRQFRWHEQFHGIPWNLECANFADMSSSMEFHGIQWNFGRANFDDTSSAMEFHGTWSAPISLTWEVPWNSMELWVRQFRWHEQFHGIPWNLECANFADTSSSMEFRGTWGAPISLTWEVQWNSMEFHGTLGAPILLTRAIPWNSMELRMRQFRWHEQFHGIPRNLEYANFNDTSSSMEFHVTRSAPISMTWAVPWNSMEFHGTLGAPISMTRAVPWNSMELGIRQFQWHEQFHGIPWN